jgi:hypothetical protein
MQTFLLSFATQVFPSKFLTNAEFFTTQVFPSIFNLRNWDEEILIQLQYHVAQKLSVTGDMAKYLILTLYRGDALFPQDLVIPFSHEAHFPQMGRWRPRRDLSEAIPQTNPDVLHPTIFYHHLSVCLSSRSLVDKDRA